ncbi:prohibitin family protein [uncultured Aquabacterium sp.]|jgi:regulator of protease activity HflC (stomatin/prohibitin superfamily)|uniref:prohibitin family protein n=1 Tax=uncultured Aquabacterium sp. TaxID=158753 RepID=UPI002626733B|nr:prohibitin family protein [uncultured Aquabacterium sp.]
MNSLSSSPSRFGAVFKGVLLVVGALFALSLINPVVVITAGERGVKTTFGKPDDAVYEPGIHFKVPLAQSMHLMDVRIQKGEGEGDAASRDLQSVHTRIAINYHLDPRRVVDVFRSIGPSTDIAADRIIIPAAQEAVKAVTARFTAEELVTRRTEVRDAIGGLLKQKMERHGLILDEFAIVNFAFSRSFAEAIEAKVKAEQEKLKAERDLQRIEVEAKQKVASARAEADALALQRQQVTRELLELRKVENEREAIRKWDGKLPNVTGGTVPFIQVKPD